MARLQDLHPDQQAVLRLVLGRRMSYSALAEVLGLTAAQVRERALDAIDGLAPDDIDGLTLEDRDLIAGYLLGQQEDAEREAAERLLADSEPAREWTGLVTPELASLVGDGLPPLPAATAAATEASLKPSGGSRSVKDAFAAVLGERRGPITPGPTTTDPSVSATAPVGNPPSEEAPTPDTATASTDSPVATGRSAPDWMRRRPALIALPVLSVIVLLGLVLLLTGAFGGDDESPTASGTTTASATPTSTTASEEQSAAMAIVSALPEQVNLIPPGNAIGAAAKAAGVGLTNINDNVPGLVFTAQNLPKLPSDRVYAIWVDGGGQTPALLGRLSSAAETGEPLVDSKGTVGRIFVPFATVSGSDNQAKVLDARQYSRVRVTRESPKATRPGATVISGSLRR